MCCVFVHHFSYQHLLNCCQKKNKALPFWELSLYCFSRSPPPIVFSILSLWNSCYSDSECWFDSLSFFSSLPFLFCFSGWGISFTHSASPSIEVFFSCFLDEIFYASRDIIFCVYLFCLVLLCFVSFLLSALFVYFGLSVWSFLGDLWLSIYLIIKGAGPS